jgi:myo-inositol-1(or 4)-monophosphatase
MDSRLLLTAIDAALRAGEIQRRRYGQEIEIEHKGAIDLVTEVDRQCEALILEALRGRYPNHDVVTEETRLARKGSRFVWFVDPLDGTTSFAHGYPCFAVSIALAVDGEVVVGVVHDPLRDDLFTTERGTGSFHNGRRMRVSTSAELITSLLITGFPYDVHVDTPIKLKRFMHVMSLARAVRRDGSAALDLCYVAGGRGVGFWEDRLCPWYLLAGKLMIEEAGGRVTRYDGGPLGLEAGEIAASNGRLHEKLLAALREESAPEWRNGQTHGT